MKKSIITLAILLSLIFTTTSQADVLDDAEREINAGNHQRGLQMMNKACNSGYTRACVGLGLSYQQGKKTPGNIVDQDITKAINFFERACQKNDKTGCEFLANVYYSVNDVNKTNIQALPHFKKACYLGSTKSCVAAGTILYNSKNKSHTNYQQAFSLYNKGCQSKFAHGCFMVAAMYLQGQGTNINEQQGKTFLKQSCNLGHQTGCDVYSKRY